jgi:CheY-like chemotaxis protein
MAAQGANLLPNILLIEDDPADHAIVRRFVEDGLLRAQLSIATSGDEAFSLLEGNGQHPDLILLDLNLPGLSGHDVLRRLRSMPKTKTTPVIVLSTSENEKDIVRSYELGANCYVPKPVTLEEFYRVVREINDFWFDVAKLPSRL